MKTTFAPSLFGLPAQNDFSETVQQQYNDTCAIKSQQLILESAGMDISEKELREEAIRNGWYFPNQGTPLEYSGKLLEYHGLPVQQQLHGSIFNLVSELSKGHPIIVGVDSGELWNKGIDETMEDLIFGEFPDHALIVGGIEYNGLLSDWQVNVIDPGTGGNLTSYDLEQFEDAWADSDYFMVTLD